MSSNNYFGAGVATDGRTWKWTVVFMTGRDRTDPVARFTTARADGETVRLGWTGYDPALVVGTAGLRGYDLERRRPGGTWSRIRTLTTKRSYAHVDPPGATFEFRLRARDKAGNIGRWTDPVSVTLPA